MDLSTSAELPHAHLLRPLFTDPAARLAMTCWADPADGTVFALSGGDTETVVRRESDGYVVTVGARTGQRLATFIADQAEDVERYLLISNLKAIGNRARGTSDPWMADPFYVPRDGISRFYDDQREAWGVKAAPDRLMALRTREDAHLLSIALVETAGIPVDDLATILGGPHPEYARDITAAAAPRPWTMDEFSDELTAFGRRIGFPVERRDDGAHLFRWAARADVAHLLPEKPPTYTYRLGLLPKNRIQLLGSAAVGFRGDAQKRQLGFDSQALLMPLGEYVAKSGWTVKDPLWARGLRALIPKR